MSAASARPPERPQLVAALQDLARVGVDHVTAVEESELATGGMYVLITQECLQIRLESRQASPGRRFADVAGVTTPGGPRLVVVVAGLLEALTHPVDEARQ